MQDYLLRQRDYLLNISRAMTARLDLPSLLQLIIGQAVEMLQGQAGLIALLGRDGEFHVRASFGLPVQAHRLFVPLLTPQVPLSDALWPMSDLLPRLQLVAASAGINLRQVVGLPLTLEDELIGVIYVFRTRGTAFSSDDRQVLSSFADQAAIAVHNATLYQQLAEEKDRLDAIIENSADGVLILDAGCHIETINRALAEMTGWTPDEARGQPCHKVIALRSRQGVNLCEKGCPLRAFEESGLAQGRRDTQTPQAEGDIIRPDGQRTSVSITYSPLYDNEGQLVHIVGSVHDVSRFREAEEMKAMFISVISHELKTPVALIKGYANTLRREDAHWDQATVRESLTIIDEESDRLDRLINNLLEASRIQAGTLKLELGDVSVPKLAAKVVERFRVAGAAASLHAPGEATNYDLQLDFPSDFPPLLADEERLQAVLANLVSNAIKYSPDGGTIRVGGRVKAAIPHKARDGVPAASRRLVGEAAIATASHPELEATASRGVGGAASRQLLGEGGYAEFYVSDQGIGIPAAQQARLFEPFYRVDSSLGRRTQGVGLGLFLCKAIVEGHGGHIWVESTPGKGSTFRFTLPLR
jgi:PAS domain S-box-containing protein